MRAQRTTVYSGGHSHQRHREGICQLVVLLAPPLSRYIFEILQFGWQSIEILRFISKIAVYSSQEIILKRLRWWTLWNTYRLRNARVWLHPFSRRVHQNVCNILLLFMQTVFCCYISPVTITAWCCIEIILLSAYIYILIYTIYTQYYNTV